MQLKDWVLSPGSRNAPITLTISNDSYFNCDSVVDERSAAFIALGKSLVSRKATVICCTSGSAALNYAPAISEAYYQNVPLLVITADRPAKWIGNGEGQSINQVNVFANYCKASYSIEVEASLSQIESVFNEIEEGLNGKQKGPIHLNVAFDEPLYETAQSFKEFKFETKEIAEESKFRIEENQIEEWNSYNRILILCGQMTASEGLLFWLKDLSADPRIVIVTETISNVRDFQFVNCIDRTLTNIKYEECKPQLVVTLGGAVISKKIKKYLRSIAKLNHWHVDEPGQSINVFECLSNSFSCQPSSFIRAVVECNNFSQISDFKNQWLTASFISEEKHEEFLVNCEWSDLRVFQLLIDTMPNNINLHLGNSSVVRYVQLFNPISSITYFGNRGVSGIDGSSSTALGVASKSDKLNLLISGDLRFVYDGNAFCNNIPKSNLKVIVINNDGGGIFRIIPGPLDTGVVKERFEVGNSASISDLCRTYGVDSMQVSELSKLENGLSWLYAESDNVKVLELVTPSNVNSEILANYFKSLSK